MPEYLVTVGAQAGDARPVRTAPLLILSARRNRTTSDSAHLHRAGGPIVVRLLARTVRLESGDPVGHHLSMRRLSALADYVVGGEASPGLTGREVVTPAVGCWPWRSVRAGLRGVLPASRCRSGRTPPGSRCGR